MTQNTAAAVLPPREQHIDICALAAAKAVNDHLTTHCQGCDKWHPSDGGPATDAPTGAINGGLLSPEESREVMRAA